MMTNVHAQPDDREGILNFLEKMDKRIKSDKAQHELVSV
jgi:hypothetical protein